MEHVVHENTKWSHAIFSCLRNKLRVESDFATDIALLSDKPRDFDNMASRDVPKTALMLVCLRVVADASRKYAVTEFVAKAVGSACA